MLYDQTEIEIARLAIEPGCRLPERNHSIDGVYRRFFQKVVFKNKTFLELGPGHYEFCDLVKRLGGNAIALELDPAMVKLGQYRGHEVHQVNLSKERFWHDLGRQFDGVFCRGSINATWFPERGQHEEFVHGIASLIKPGGWGWISPWNANSANLPDAQAEETYRTQEACFASEGFRVLRCNRLHARRFKLSTVKLPFLIFLKGIEYRHFFW
ncbi:MAG: class I SAM-dependent methyltransferase [Planctomycetaceae bacterium]|nr:class I SAM-dependent methyltransferase [Planctomycetaceae bacterium]